MTDLRFPGKSWVLKLIRGPLGKSTKQNFKFFLSLSHPQLVKVVDCFEDQESAYLILEYVQGRSLESILEENDIPLPERQVLSWGIQSADALIYLHEHVKPFGSYRNFSPRKILISVSGQIKVLPRLITYPELYVSPSAKPYAPPEVFDDKKLPDEQADIYSLAASIHRCLIPRNEKPIPFVYPALNSQNPKLVSLIEQVIEKATRPEKGKRFPSLRVFRRELHDCLKDVLTLEPVPIRRATIAESFWWLIVAMSAISTGVWLYLSRH